MLKNIEAKDANMIIKPLNDTLIIKRLEKDLTTASGIVLQSSDEADKALVLAIGPLVEDVNLGDTILANWNNATKIQNSLYKLHQEDVVGIFE
jgi:co-chaperonin GroES (HSP10)